MESLVQFILEKGKAGVIASLVLLVVTSTAFYISFFWGFPGVFITIPQEISILTSAFIGFFYSFLTVFYCGILTSSFKGDHEDLMTWFMLLGIISAFIIPGLCTLLALIWPGIIFTDYAYLVLATFALQLFLVLFLNFMIKKGFIKRS